MKMKVIERALKSNYVYFACDACIICCALVGIFILLLQLYGLMGLDWFELPYIRRLLGIEGIAILTIFDIGILLGIFYVLFKIILKQRVKVGTIWKIGILIWFLVFLWVLEWLFMENPVTIRIRRSFLNNKVKELVIGEFALQSIVEDCCLIRQRKDNKSLKKFLIMYERTRLNRPKIYSNFSICKTIDKYAKIYHIEPVLLFYWLYLGSFYGEATSGKIPFLRTMTSETFRDFIQVHLPYLFVESRLRKYLIESPFLENLGLGKKFGHKLRYAFHKATYDVSLEPYDANIFSDVFLVLREYKEEFPEIFTNANLDKLTISLREAFLQLADHCLLRPYERPYTIPVRPKEYYSRHRDTLILFSRATFYKCLFDFEFATKIQVLLARYYENQFIKVLGNSFWEKVPTKQKCALIVMLRDVYRPNIGKLSYNVYALPEFNCTPFDFVANEAVREKQKLLKKNEIWRPRDYERLWSAAAFKLYVFSEVWQVIYGKQLAPLMKSNTIRNALQIVLMNSTK